MSVFLEIADQYAVADAAFADVEQQAFKADDDAAFDRAIKARQRTTKPISCTCSHDTKPR